MMMNNYKEFLQLFRKKEFETVCILVHDENISIKLTKYVGLICNINLNTEAYFLYYGEIQGVVSSFLQYWSSYIDRCIINADKYSNNDQKKDLIELIEKTIMMQQEKQIFFGNEYLPVVTNAEKLIHEEIERLFKDYMEKLYDVKNTVEKFDKKEHIINFVAVHFKVTLGYYRELLDYAHSFIGMMLVDRLKEIKISVEEIQLRMTNNLKSFQEEYDTEHRTMLNKLYEKNKEQILLHRKASRPSTEVAELRQSIETLSKKINKDRQVNGLVRLQEEVEYWKKRIDELNIICNNLNKLKIEQDHLKKQQETYDSLKTTELPGSKLETWKNIGENYSDHREFLKTKTIEAAKSLITFFYVQGRNRKIFHDDVGSFFIDSLNHHVYSFDSGMHFFHVVCDGYKEIKDVDEYYYDRNGRFILDHDGSKVYKRAACASSYKLNEENYLVKVSKDCGHSEMYNENCKQNFKDPNDIMLLPFTEPMDIKKSLDKEVTSYLWDCFGYILPDVLHDVGLKKPNNPIPFMAHRLLYYKYQKSHKDTDLKRKEAALYREKIFQERKEKAEKEARFFKSKQTRRRKPEESDDSGDRAVYNTYVATQDFIKSLDFYN